MSDSIPEPIHEEAAFILKKARELVATMLQETDEQVRQQIIEAEAKGQQDGQEASKPQHEALQKLETVLHTELSQKGVIASMSLVRRWPFFWVISKPMMSSAQADTSTAIGPQALNGATPSRSLLPLRSRPPVSTKKTVVDGCSIFT